MLESLILEWGYAILFLGTLLEGESILLAAGAMAHKGLMHLPWVMVVAAIGGFMGDVIWYFVGRKFGLPFIEKRPKLRGRIEPLTRYSTKYGSLFVIAMRFIYGIRTAAPVFLGARNYPMGRYLIANALGAIIWAVVISTLGYQLGAGFKELFLRYPHAEEILIGVAVAVVLFVAGHFLWKKRVASRMTPPGL